MVFRPDADYGMVATSPRASGTGSATSSARWPARRTGPTRVSAGSSGGSPAARTGRAAASSMSLSFVRLDAHPTTAARRAVFAWVAPVEAPRWPLPGSG
ncbi:hypothetical protein AB0K60_18205 [Thermopolyspora sp. NPDC052614]|uniref:hypothetical protein n=1 Tax=Thermopolyspora sp. NPDC052614 TaxID=3155682 RepID=UPI00341D2B17